MTEAEQDVRRNRRLQSAVDVFTGVIIAMLAWPFPVARAVLSPSTHIFLVVLSCVVATVVYFELTVLLWRRALGMRLAGLCLAEPGRQGRMPWLLWAFVSAVGSFVYIAFPPSSNDLAGRLTGIRLT